MLGLKLPMAILAAVVLSGAASVAHAQTTTRPSNTAARDTYNLNQSQQPRVLELDSGSRWGIRLELQPPVTREMQLKDVEAGAYYKLTPSLRLGGQVGLADRQAPAAETKAQDAEVTPRVRLGAIFKF